ncbi:hypothetical protein D3C71_1959960 [compost metagenome]
MAEERDRPVLRIGNYVDLWQGILGDLTDLVNRIVEGVGIIKETPRYFTPVLPIGGHLLDGDERRCQHSSLDILPLV